MSLFPFPAHETLDQAALALAELCEQVRKGGTESAETGAAREARDPAGVGSALHVKIAPLLSVAVQVPAGRSLALLQPALACSFDEMVYYQDAAPDSPVVVGLGCAHRLRMESEDPFSEAMTRLGQLRLHCDDALKGYVRHFGGGAFDPRRRQDETCWQNYANASFLLPRLTYLQWPQGAALVLSTTAEEIAETLDAAREVVELLVHEEPLSRAISASASKPESRRSSSDGSAPLRILASKNSADEQTWVELLDRAQALMGQGRLAKVVTARRMTVQVSRSPDLAEVVDRLREQAQGCTIFALRIHERIFLGATPETLVRAQGYELATEALAGTLASEGSGPVQKLEEQLLASPKDRHEHELVVEAISAAIKPYCSSLNVPETPQVRRLRRMLHLRTPISATLRQRVHILSLVRSLHPTPAVGGVPQQTAIDFIFDHEQVERGWYAAPFGWCNDAGDGHFVVALRSALIAGDKIHIYAGAGIVPASDAHAEYMETELKMGSMLGALGLAS